jgi:hypothetical protein
MSFDYAPLQATANDLISQFGQLATLRKYVASGPAFSPSVTHESHDCQIVDMTHMGKMSDGTRIETGESLLYMAKGSLTVEPTLSDQVTFGGQTYQIIKTMPLKPGGIVLFYEIQARR